MKYIFLLIIFSFLDSTYLYAQSIVLTNIDDSNFPRMKANYLIIDQNNQRIENVDLSDFRITEMGVQRNILSLYCDTIVNNNAISSVLSIDISRSMTKNGLDRLTIAKSAALYWVNALNLDKSECAVTTFDNLNYLNQDLTQEKDFLINAINTIQVKNTTDFDYALIGKPAGSLIISKNAVNPPVILFLTDAFAFGNNSGIKNKDVIINEAIAQNCPINIITMGNKTNSELMEIAEKSGGSWYDEVNTEAAIKSIYQSLLNKYIENTPCTIEWESDYMCSSSKYELKLEYLPLSISSSTFLKPKDENIANSTASPIVLDFGGVLPLTSEFLSTTITAIVDDLIVTDILSSNNLFTISPTAFTLLQGQSIELEIEYTAQDSSTNFTTFTFNTNKCGKDIFAKAGFPGIKSKKSDLKVLSPNGGEKFLFGSDTIITWKGVPITEQIKIQFSSDNGNNWNVLDNNADGLTFNWTKLPPVASDLCLVKVESMLDFTTLGLGELIRTFNNQDSRSIVFSPNGTQFATGSFDGNIRIMDLDGNIINNFLAHNNNNNVFSLAYNTDGSLLLSGSRDGLKIWDADNWNLIRTISGFHYFVNFSIDGQYIITSNLDNDKIEVYDTNSWTLVFSDDKRTFAGNFSKDMRFIISDNRNNNQISIYETTTWSLVSNINNVNQRVESVDFSADGLFLAIGYFGGDINIYSTINWNLVRTIGSHNNDISKLEFSSDGLYLISSSKDATIRIWEVSSWDELIILNDHSNIVSDFDINFSNENIISCSEDLTIKFWNLKSVIIDQTDISDNVFSIIEPVILSSDIDMGTEYINNFKEEFFTDFIENKSIGRVRIDSIVIINDAENSFSILSNNSLYYINRDENLGIEFSFAPKTEGVKNADILIYTQYNTISQSITGIGLNPQFELSDNLIDFGEVYFWSKKDSICNAVINVSQSDILITNVELEGINGLDFYFNTPFRSTILVPGDTLKLDLRFKPSYIGGTSGIAKVFYEPSIIPVEVPLFGRGISPDKFVRLQLDTIEINSGEEFMLGLKVEDLDDLIEENTFDVYANLQFNPTVIEPLKNRGFIRDNKREIPFQFSLNNKSNGYISFVEFKSALGNDSETTVEISIDSVTSNLPVFVKTGLVKIMDLCFQGGVRLINNTDIGGILNISPNPTYDKNIKININNIEDGVLEIKLFNIKGELVEILNTGYLDKGQYNYKINANNLSKGIYYLRYKSDSIQQVKKIIII